MTTDRGPGAPPPGKKVIDAWNAIRKFDKDNTNSKRRSNCVPPGRRKRVPARRPWANSVLTRKVRPCLSLSLMRPSLGQGP